ncbi:MAG: septum formation initiator family protein [Candidatus Zhuqueibacterota bacterium]
MVRKNRRKNGLMTSFSEVQKELDKPTNSLIVLVVIIVLAAVMVGLVWQKVKIAQLAEDIVELEKQEQQCRETIEKLKGKVLSLSSENRIVNIARERLDMIYPTIERVSVPVIKDKKQLEVKP